MRNLWTKKEKRIRREFVFAFLFLLGTLRKGASFSSVYTAWVLTFLYGLDAREHRIPDRHLLLFLPLTYRLFCLSPAKWLLNQIFFCSLFFLLQERMGLGDYKLLYLLLFTEERFYQMFFYSLLFTLFSALLGRVEGEKRKELPYVPYLYLAQWYLLTGG